MKIYISGRITGMPIEEAQQSFAAMEAILIKAGATVVNPVTLTHDHDKTWISYMRECIIALMACEAVVMLDTWSLSKGACVEFNLAFDLGMKIYNERGKPMHLALIESANLKNNLFDN